MRLPCSYTWIHATTAEHLADVEAALTDLLADCYVAVIHSMELYL